MSVSITGAATGFSNLDPTKQVDSYGRFASWLTANWPPDTYTFTATSASGTITKTYTKPR